MSDPSAGARAPDTTPRADVPVTETYPTTGQSASSGDRSAVRQAAGQSARAAGQAAGDVKDTAKEQARRVGSEAKTQARTVASEVRGRMSERARTQNDRLVSGIREMADHLDDMRGGRAESPATQIVSRVADSGRQVAGYLERNGPEGVLREVQDFARRRPGAFLAAALAAGFVVARLGKGLAKADDLASDTAAKPASDTFVSGPGSYETGAAGYVDPAVDPATGYPGTSTEYASTGTGTPVVVEQEYVEQDYATGTTRDYPGGAR
jgi:hypothetical protein